MKTNSVEEKISVPFIFCPDSPLPLLSLLDHSAKTYTVHHVKENQSEDEGAEIILETMEATVAEPTVTTETPTPTTTTSTSATTTTKSTTTITNAPTTTTVQRAEEPERPAPTIVLVLDNSNNDSRPILHRAGECLTSYCQYVQAVNGATWTNYAIRKNAVSL